MEIQIKSTSKVSDLLETTDKLHHKDQNFLKIKEAEFTSMFILLKVWFLFPLNTIIYSTKMMMNFFLAPLFLLWVKMALYLRVFFKST